MPDAQALKVAILDYGLGNLFSVKHACEHAGMHATITCSHEEILKADAVILPGMGAFGDAMESLRRLDLTAPLRDVVSAGKALIGVCLGMQLLMSESYEFGRHQGLGFIEGSVVKFDNPVEGSTRLKVPQIEWNNIYRNPGHQAPARATANGDPWKNSPLEGLANGEFMYFVHSYHAQPASPEVALSLSEYGHIQFCSSLRRGNIFAFQFHPERSGPHGLRIYKNLAALIGSQDPPRSPGDNNQNE
jgi:imidazole glycerol-phosphate synthase subunit HisH